MSLFKKPIVYIVACILFTAGGAGVYYMFFVSYDPIPQNIRLQVSFTLYYPKSLPSGWSIDKSSFYTDPSVQVVGYRLRGPSGYLNVTIQPVPKSFDFNNFYTKRLSGTVQFLTPLGQGAIGTAGNQLVGSLETPSSWVLASPSTKSVREADIQFVLSHLQAT